MPEPYSVTVELFGRTPEPVVWMPTTEFDDTTESNRSSVAGPPAVPPTMPLLCPETVLLRRVITAPSLTVSAVLPLPISIRLSNVPDAATPPAGLTRMPWPALAWISTSRRKIFAPATVGSKSMHGTVPEPKPNIATCSTNSVAPWTKLMHFVPRPETPLIVMLRTFTTTPAPLTVMPGVPWTRIEPTWPLMPPAQSSVIVLTIVTPPKPPGSRQSISPPAAVLEMAPGKVLHGAVRLHGLTSSPTPEIQVRVAWAGA